jgi:hypothetical protein
VVPIKRPAGRDHNFRAIRRAGADGDCGGTAAGADLRRLDGFLVIFASFPSRLGVDRRARGSAPGSPARVTRHTEREAGASRLGSADQAWRTAATTVRFFGHRPPDRARRPSSHPPAPPPSSAIRAEPGRLTHNRVSGCWACSAPVHREREPWQLPVRGWRRNAEARRPPRRRLVRRSTAPSSISDRAPAGPPQRTLAAVSAETPPGVRLVRFDLHDPTAPFVAKVWCSRDIPAGSSVLYPNNVSEGGHVWAWRNNSTSGVKMTSDSTATDDMNDNGLAFWVSTAALSGDVAWPVSIECQSTSPIAGGSVGDADRGHRDADQCRDQEDADERWPNAHGVQVARAVRHELGQLPQSVPADDG